jgi:hypothetical protein
MLRAPSSLFAAAVNPYDPKSEIDFSKYDPSADPGVDPVFVTDTALNKTEDYTFVFTKPGDHKLPDKTVPFQFDTKGTASLLQVITARQESLHGCKGIAIYLVNGTSLKPDDLKTVQTFNKPVKDGGLGLTSIDTLYIYNLKSLDGGVESKAPAMPGTPIRVFMWDNGWATSAYKNLILDDLEEVKDGTFCGNPFHSVSLRAARTIGVMAFGGHRNSKPPLAAIYLPSVTHIGEHAFRRCKNVVTANLPRVTLIGAYAFDDMTALRYVNAPELKTLGRNGFNDDSAIISVNMPKLESLGVASMGPNDAMRILRLPSLTKGFELNAMHAVKFLYLPSLKTLSDQMVGANVQAIYLPKVEIVQKNSFAGAIALRKVDLPSAKKVDPDAFPGLKNIEITIAGKKKVLP